MKRTICIAMLALFATAFAQAENSWSPCFSAGAENIVPSEGPTGVAFQLCGISMVVLNYNDYPVQYAYVLTVDGRSYRWEVVLQPHSWLESTPLCGYGECSSSDNTPQGSHTTSRDPAERRKFMHSHPCPSTGKTSGACPGYVVDHIKALKRGGADDPSNMQWQTKEDAKDKDKVE